MLNDYNQRVALETNSELDKTKAELAENQRKVSGIIKMVTEGRNINRYSESRLNDA